MGHRWSCTLVLVLLLLAACKKEEPLPEHVVQQQARERARKQRQKQLKQAAREAPPGARDSYRLWSPAVRQAFYSLLRAREMQIPKAARTLAQLGLPAADALRAIAADKEQPPKKHALVSFMLVDLHMFQIEALAKMAREPELPFAQRAAMQALARIGNGRTEGELDKLAQELPKMAAPAQKQDPDLPELEQPVRFLQKVRREVAGHKWAYSEGQLATLDRVLQADSPQKLRIAINALKDSTLEPGLQAILRSPVARSAVQAGVAFKLVEMGGTSPRALRALCGRDEHPFVRLNAARKLLESGKASSRAFVAKLAADDKDPMAPMLRRALEQVKRQKRKP
jgi:hypothetical protein